MADADTVAKPAERCGLCEALGVIFFLFIVVATFAGVAAAGYFVGLHAQGRQLTDPSLTASSGRPPARFQNDMFVGVLFGDQAKITADCGSKQVPNAIACETQDGKRIPLLELPNPCDTPEAYAMMVCHELGHANGWPGNHPNASDWPWPRAYAVSFAFTCAKGGDLQWGASVVAINEEDAEKKGLKVLTDEEAVEHLGKCSTHTVKAY